MISRKEIETIYPNLFDGDKMTLELLLDIRDLLQQLKENQN